MGALCRVYRHVHRMLDGTHRDWPVMQCTSSLPCAALTLSAVAKGDGVALLQGLIPIKAKHSSKGGGLVLTVWYSNEFLNSTWHDGTHCCRRAQSMCASVRATSVH